MVDFNKLDEIGRKYFGKKLGYNFRREIKLELNASLLDRLLEDAKERLQNSSKENKDFKWQDVTKKVWWF